MPPNPPADAAVFASVTDLAGSAPVDEKRPCVSSSEKYAKLKTSERSQRKVMNICLYFQESNLYSAGGGNNSLQCLAQ